MTNNQQEEPWAYLYLSSDNTCKVPLFNKRITFGRSIECEYSFPNNHYLSTNHGYIEYDKNKVYFYDSSTNGTWINLNFKINKQKYELKSHDRVFLVYRLNDIQKTLYFDLIKVDEEKNNEDIDDETQNKKIKLEEQDDLLENLACQICYEIMHDPISLQPCMHSYCAGCYSEWMLKSNYECPVCRLKSKLICKSHVLNNIIEAYLKHNPHRKRSKEELDMLNAKNTIKQDIILEEEKKENSLNGEHEDEQEDYYEDEYEEDKDDEYKVNQQQFFNFKSVQPAVNNCRQCLVNKRMHPQTNLKYPDYTCSLKQNHILCVCCLSQMPDRSEDIKRKTLKQEQKCFVCSKVYCNLYWKCNRTSCKGCLLILQDFKLDTESEDNLINNNLYETKVLQDYLKEKKNQTTISNLVQELLRKLKNGAIKSNIIKDKFASEKAVCISCSFRIIKELIYDYRLSINDLPNEVTNRPNCRWGKECRTQVHNIDHAKRFNHVCEVTNKL